MKAMILAAGRGERMRPLTDSLPKPLLPVGEQTLIEHHLRRLQSAGFSEVVINVSWLAELIQQQLGDGSRYGVKIHWSPEPVGALETGGALRRALPLLGDTPFLLVNGDVWTDYPFANLRSLELAPQQLVHCVLVPNPPQHPDGDFVLHRGELLDAVPEPMHRPLREPALSDNVAGLLSRHTYSGIGLYRPELVADHPEGRFPLAPLLKSAIANRRAGGELYNGDWRDIGTPQRLQQLQAEFCSAE